MQAEKYARRIQGSIEFIEANLKEELRLNDISQKANASLFHFHRLFRAFVGQSLGEYVRNRRLAHAAHDLALTKRRIIDIAFDYGYSAPESFLRAFKAMYGMTPRDSLVAIRAVNGAFSAGIMPLAVAYAGEASAQNDRCLKSLGLKERP